MISKFLKTAAALATLCLALNASAQVVVLDFFTPGTRPTAISDGTWVSMPSPSQGPYSLQLRELSNDDASGAWFNFATPLDLTDLSSLTLLGLNAGMQPGVSLSVSLFDQEGDSVSALFDLSTFSQELFSGQTALVNDLSFGAFDANQIASLKIGGTDAFGAGIINFDIAQIRATQVHPVSAVPEPSTYAALGAGSLLLLSGLRRRKQAVKA